MQWYQIDLGPPTLITGVVLRPRGDGKWQQYVTLFKLSYSNDSLLWFFYKDAAHLDQRVRVKIYLQESFKKKNKDNILSKEFRTHF